MLQTIFFLLLPAVFGKIQNYKAVSVTKGRKLLPETRFKWRHCDIQNTKYQTYNILQFNFNFEAHKWDSNMLNATFGQYKNHQMVFESLEF